MRKKIIRNTTCIVTAAILLIFFAVTVLMYIHTVDLLKTGTENEARSLKAAIDMEGLEFLEAGRCFRKTGGLPWWLRMGWCSMIRWQMR